MTEAPPVGAFRSRRGRGALFRQRCGWLTGKGLAHPSRQKSASRPGRRAPRAPGNGASRRRSIGTGAIFWPPGEAKKGGGLRRRPPRPVPGQPAGCCGRVVRVQFHPQPVTAKMLRRHQRRTRTGERVQNQATHRAEGFHQGKE